MIPVKPDWLMRPLDDAAPSPSWFNINQKVTSIFEIKLKASTKTFDGAICSALGLKQVKRKKLPFSSSIVLLLKVQYFNSTTSREEDPMPHTSNPINNLDHIQTATNWSLSLSPPPFFFFLIQRTLMIWTKNLYQFGDPKAQQTVWSPRKCTKRKELYI